MVLVEYEIEKSVRSAIRTSIDAFTATAPELQDCIIVGDWLAPED
jgi:hypothetical protein